MDVYKKRREELRDILDQLQVLLYGEEFGELLVTDICGDCECRDCELESTGNRCVLVDLRNIRDRVFYKSNED